MTELTEKHRRKRAKKCWDHMFDRCYNPRHANFANYGGRGIKVCKKWFDFDAFYRDVGDPPISSLSLDRRDNRGNYEPGNVRWATPHEQNVNSRNPPKSTILDNGYPISYSEAAERLGTTWRQMAKRMAKLRKQGTDKADFADLKARTDAARALRARK